MIIEVRPLGHGMFSARCGTSELVSSSRQPFLDAARVLAAMGVAEDTRIVMRHEGSDDDALISTVGKAAKLAVKEVLRGKYACSPKFVRWTSFAGRRENGDGNDRGEGNLDAGYPDSAGDTDRTSGGISQ